MHGCMTAIVNIFHTLPFMLQCKVSCIVPVTGHVTGHVTCNCRLQVFGDVVIGSVLGPSSQRANECRIAMFLAGYPETVPVRTVNRFVSRPSHI